MADTQRGGLEDVNCSDCGEKGCVFKHWGDLVPEGKIGYFCWFCWKVRDEASGRGGTPKPLGVQPPGIPEEFLDKKVKVTTESGSIYELDLTDNKQERIVSCNRRKLHFSRTRVICLTIGNSLFLRPRDGSIADLWWTSPVISIEPII
ncbi:MAG TPA: hypothetical protein VJ378_00675 [Candidatus Paceibacterota bacterium]|nr:hypothetical protein [Candidatus Paceibacterota bacterium]